MKSSDIAKQLITEMPKYTDLFTTPNSITSLTFSGGTVTAITSSAHGLTTGSYVTIEGGLFQNELTSLTFSDGVATAVTSVPHDLTEGWPEHAEITISGADQSEYNGSNPLVSANDRNTFQFSVSGTPVSPATGTIYLEEDRIDTFNGRYEVTVIDTTTFIYTTDKTLSAAAGGTPVLYGSARITPIVDAQMALSAYTEQNLNDYWLFVVGGEATISRDRAIDNDAAQLITRSESKRILEIEKLSLFAFIPMTDDLGGVAAQDNVDVIYPAILKSICGYKPPSYLTEDRVGAITPESHSYFGRQPKGNAVYIHEFRFESVRNISTDDLLPPLNTRAFRDILMLRKNEFGETIMSNNVDLDDDA